MWLLNLVRLHYHVAEKCNVTVESIQFMSINVHCKQGRSHGEYKKKNYNVLAKSTETLSCSSLYSKLYLFYFIHAVTVTFLNQLFSLMLQNWRCYVPVVSLWSFLCFFSSLHTFYESVKPHSANYIIYRFQQIAIQFKALAEQSKCVLVYLEPLLALII